MTSGRHPRPRRNSVHVFRSPLDEAERDQGESTFTPILRELWANEPDVMAAVFVDPEGECVDYCSSLPPFDAKVAGAHMQAILFTVRGFAEKVGAGEPAMLEVNGDQRDIVLRRLDDGYLLVVIVASGGADQRVLHGMERAVQRLREEAGLSVPTWDPELELEVSVREAVGWEFAPVSFTESGKRHAIAHVLGRWEEAGGLAGDHLFCFRVRTEDDTELTLAYDEAEGRWLRW